MWSEDYYVTLLQEYFKTFDSLISNGIPLLGEMIWNFADFKTPQGKIKIKIIISIVNHISYFRIYKTWLMCKRIIY